MDTLIIVAIIGFAGICVAAAAPIMLALQARAAATRAEERAIDAAAAAREARIATLEAREAARESTNATAGVSSQVKSLQGQVDGNLTEMIRLAKAAASAEARADEKQRGLDKAIEVAEAAAKELDAAKQAPPVQPSQAELEEAMRESQEYWHHRSEEDS